MGTLENLDGHYKSILQQVIVDHAIEDVDGAVIRGRSEQGILRILVEANFTDRLVVILEGFVGSLATHIHVEPKNLLVICTKDEVISLWMHRDGRNPFSTRLILAHDRLLLQVVLKDCGLCSSEEMRLRWMERNALNDSISCRERFH